MGGGRMAIWARRWTSIPGLGFRALLCLLTVLTCSRSAGAAEPWTGAQILDEVLRRERLLAFLYEEQTVILKDKSGNRDVRKVRRFFRLEEDGTFKFLLVFDTPAEVQGVAILKVDPPSGRGESSIYLPAFDKGLITRTSTTGGDLLPVMDFKIGDLTADVPADYRCERAEDQKIDLSPCYVVEVTPRKEETQQVTGCSLRRYFIRQDEFRIVRTDSYDRRKRFFKRQTFHDPVRVKGELWKANMTLTENHRERLETLIKTDRRVISADYVPPEIFTPAWLLANRHIRGAEKRLLRQPDPPSPREMEEALPEGPLSQVRQGPQAGSPGAYR
jgi:hypothetical protein